MMEVQTVSSCTLGSHKSLVFGSLYFLLHDHGRHTAGIQKHLFSTLKPRTPKGFQHFACAKESERRGKKTEGNHCNTTRHKEKTTKLQKMMETLDHLFNLCASNPHSKHSLLTWPHRKHKGKQYGETGT